MRKRQSHHKRSFIFLLAALFISTFLMSNYSVQKSQQANVLEESPQKQEQIARRIATHCSRELDGLWQRLVCYSQEMEKVSLKEGQASAHDVLIALQQVDPTSRNCHFIAHGIGGGAYKRDPSRMRELIAKSSALCNGGEQHGIIEQYMETLPSQELIKENVAGICGKNPLADCNRMVGHMLLVETQNDMDKAIDLCNGLTNNEQQFICYGGLMMEKFIGYNLMDHGIIAREDLTKKLPEFRKYCDSLQGNIELACWQGLAHPAYYYFDDEPRKVFAFCNSAPYVEAARECKIHALSELVHVLRKDIDESRKICGLDSSNDEIFEKKCYMELAALYLKPNLINSSQAKNVGTYCSSLPVSHIKDCFGTIGNSLDSAYLPKEQVKSYCKESANTYFDDCYKGA